MNLSYLQTRLEEVELEPPHLDNESSTSESYDPVEAEGESVELYCRSVDAMFREISIIDRTIEKYGENGILVVSRLYPELPVNSITGQEGLKEFAVKIWEFLKKLCKKVIGFISSIWNKIFGHNDAAPIKTFDAAQIVKDVRQMEPPSAQNESVESEQKPESKTEDKKEKRTPKVSYWVPNPRKVQELIHDTMQTLKENFDSKQLIDVADDILYLLDLGLNTSGLPGFNSTASNKDHEVYRRLDNYWEEHGRADNWVKSISTKLSVRIPVVNVCDDRTSPDYFNAVIADLAKAEQQIENMKKPLHEVNLRIQKFDEAIRQAEKEFNRSRVQGRERTLLNWTRGQYVSYTSRVTNIYGVLNTVYNKIRKLFHEYYTKFSDIAKKLKTARS